MSDGPRFFDGPPAWRAWLEAHHATERSVSVGYHKKSTGKAALTWPQSVDEALCFGWIDGVRKGIDADTYAIRFTPRKPTSNWSAVNVKRVGELLADGRMHAAGLAAFARRREPRTGVYSYEQRDQARLDDAEDAAFRAHLAAWADWERRPPGYRRNCLWWVVSPKKAETRARRLQTLIACCAAGEYIPPFRPVGKR